MKAYPSFNSLRPRPNRRYFADDIFKRIFENENEWISPRISLKFVPKVRINNIPALVQIMAWRRPGDKPLSEPMMVCLLTHICVTRPQWVNKLRMVLCHMIYTMPFDVRGLLSSSQWRHDKRDGVSKHYPNDCLLNRFFRHRSKKTSKLRVTGLCAGNSLLTVEFPIQRASNAENVSIWWRYHANRY